MDWFGPAGQAHESFGLSERDSQRRQQLGAVKVDCWTLGSLRRHRGTRAPESTYVSGARSHKIQVLIRTQEPLLLPD
jgi:hypothetical protein